MYRTLFYTRAINRVVLQMECTFTLSLNGLVMTVLETQRIPQFQLLLHCNDLCPNKDPTIFLWNISAK